MLEHVGENLGPFSIKQVVRGPERGSKINPTMSVIGFQPTGQDLADPEFTELMRERYNREAWRRKERADGKQEQRYGGPE
jgi:hypothetical protein